MGTTLWSVLELTHWMLESSKMVASNVPELSQAAATTGDVQIRIRHRLLHEPLGNSPE